MTLNEERRQKAQAAVNLLHMIPDGTWVELSDRGLAFQGFDQSRTAEIRSWFRGAIWEKKYDEACQWWTYSTVFGGVAVFIYAVSEAPPTCKRIEEEYTVEEDVPVTFERKTVVKTRVRFECGNGDGTDVATGTSA